FLLGFIGAVLDRGANGLHAFLADSGGFAELSRDAAGLGDIDLIGYRRGRGHGAGLSRARRVRSRNRLCAVKLRNTVDLHCFLSRGQDGLSRVARTSAGAVRASVSRLKGGCETLRLI